MVHERFDACRSLQPLGIDIIRLIKKRVKIPVLASGAITLENVGEVISEGADGAAVSRAVCGAVSPKEAAVKFDDMIVASHTENNVGVH